MRFSVDSNHGNAKWTCVYRLRVHGAKIMKEYIHNYSRRKFNEFVFLEIRRLLVCIKIQIVITDYIRKMGSMFSVSSLSFSRSYASKISVVSLRYYKYILVQNIFSLRASLPLFRAKFQKSTHTSLKQRRLFHYAKKLLLVHLPISISVRLFDHLL